MQHSVQYSITDIQKLLSAKDINPSFQRLKILEFIIKSKKHPSVDTIFRSLSKKIPTLSRTTIYNTLTLFTQKGLVNSLSISDNEVRYDFADNPHAHFQCRICYKIYDLEVHGIQNSIKRSQHIHPEGKCPLYEMNDDNNYIEGHKIEKIQTSLRGICKTCLGK